jgi:hypothetical protein
MVLEEDTVLVGVGGIEMLAQAAVSNGWVSFENWQDREIDTKYIRRGERQKAFERIRTLERRGVTR